MDQDAWLQCVGHSPLSSPFMQKVKINTLVRVGEISQRNARVLPPYHWHDRDVAMAHDTLAESSEAVF